MMRNVTVLSSGKGGDGKSTVAAGLGCGLALRGRKTVLLDLNPLGGTAPDVLGAASGSPYHLGDVTAGDCQLLDAVFPCDTMEGLDLTLPPVTADGLPGKNVLLHWLVMLSLRYDQILVEMPCWSPCFAAASQAETTLFIAGADKHSTACCDRLRTSPQGQQVQNPRLVLNRFHRQQFLRAGEFDDLDQVIDRCGVQLLAVVPADPQLSGNLPEAMVSTLDHRQKCSQKGFGGAMALHNLARRLLGETVPLLDLDAL